MRAIYRAKGMTAAEAQLAALSKFPPPGMVIDSLADKPESEWGKSPRTNIDKLVPSAQRKESVVDIPAEFIPQVAKEQPEQPAKRIERDGIDKEVARAKTQETSTSATGKRIAEEMYWIYENLAVRGLTIDDAPSAGAFAYLKDCQNDPLIKASFRKDIFAKLIPSRSVLEEAEKRRDSGRTAIDLLERLRQIAQPVDEFEDFNNELASSSGEAESSPPAGAGKESE